MLHVVKASRLTGERALFKARDLQIEDCIFADGESPLKESRNIHVVSSSFQWKYPFCYSKDIIVKNSSFFLTSIDIILSIIFKYSPGILVAYLELYI